MSKPLMERDEFKPRKRLAKPKKLFRIALVATACIHVFCAGGLLLGWPVVATIADKEGFDAKFVHKTFVYACTCNMIAQLISGWVLDRFGPRLCSSICILEILIGCLIYGISPLGDETTFLVGWCLIGFGACGVQTSTFHLSNLFPSKKSTIMAVINSCFILSSIIPGSLVAIIYSMGMDPVQGFHRAFTAWAGVLALCMLAALVLFPDAPYVFEECQAIMTPANPKKTASRLSKPVFHSRPSVFMTSKRVTMLRRRLEEKENKHNLSLWGQLASPEFISTLVLFTVCSFWFNFFLGTLQMRTQDIFGAKQSYYYVRFFTAVYPFSALLNPAVGWLLDRCGFGLGIVLNITLGMASSVVLALEHFLVGSMIFIVWSSMIFNYTYSYIAHVFGFTYYGILMGIMFVVAGLFNLVQPLILELDDWTTTSWIEFFSLLLVMLVSVVCHWHSMLTRCDDVIAYCCQCCGSGGDGDGDADGRAGEDDPLARNVLRGQSQKKRSEESARIIGAGGSATFYQSL